MPQPQRASSRRRKPASEATEFGRLRSYAIEGLFGRGNFHFELDPHEPTLLTGVNGTGKSTILRTIDAVSSTQWSALTDIPFKRIVLGFEYVDVVIDRNSENPELTVRVGPWGPWTYVDNRRLHALRNSVIRDAAIHGYMLDEDRLWEPWYLEELSRQFKSTASAAAVWSLMRDEESLAAPSWVTGIKSSFPVLFVTDQRLVVESPGNPKEHRGAERVPTKVAVEDAAHQVWRQIQRAKSEYATVAQELDSNFPQRVVHAMGPDHTPSASLRSNLKKLLELRKGLEQTGLLAAEESFASADLGLENPYIRAVIETYVQDTSRKLATLEPLRRRLKLFADFLNQHYVSKRVVIDQEKGFRIEVNDGSGALPPARLSSGEQQILVLAHRILFGTRRRTFVLIDEPELSLHVVWQSTFVDDLARMGEVDDLTFLLATHSPTLIHGREDLKRSLDLR